MLSEQEGRRHEPLSDEFSAQLTFNTAIADGVVQLPEGTDLLTPGDHLTVDVRLSVPNYISDKERFALLEDGRTIGVGIVATIIVVTMHRRHETSEGDSVAAPSASLIALRPLH